MRCRYENAQNEEIRAVDEDPKERHVGNKQLGFQFQLSGYQFFSSVLVKLLGQRTMRKEDQNQHER